MRSEAAQEGGEAAAALHQGRRGAIVVRQVDQDAQAPTKHLRRLGPRLGLDPQQPRLNAAR